MTKNDKLLTIACWFPVIEGKLLIIITTIEGKKTDLDAIGALAAQKKAATQRIVKKYMSQRQDVAMPQHGL